VFALLAFGLHQGMRAWKSFDMEALNLLHSKGYINDPLGEAKSIVFSEEGLREAQRLLQVTCT
jgi:hypothetical protein